MSGTGGRNKGSSSGLYVCHTLARCAVRSAYEPCEIGTPKMKHRETVVPSLSCQPGQGEPGLKARRTGRRTLLRNRAIVAANRQAVPRPRCSYATQRGSHCPFLTAGTCLPAPRTELGCSRCPTTVPQSFPTRPRGQGHSPSPVWLWHLAVPAGAGETGLSGSKPTGTWHLVPSLFGEPTWCGLLVTSKHGGAQGAIGPHVTKARSRAWGQEPYS